VEIAVLAKLAVPVHTPPPPPPPQTSDTPPLVRTKGEVSRVLAGG